MTLNRQVSRKVELKVLRQIKRSTVLRALGRHWEARPEGLARCDQLTQHIVQDAAGLEVLDLVQRYRCGTGLRRCRGCCLRAESPGSAACEGCSSTPSRPAMVRVSLPVSLRLVRLSPALNCSGNTPMPTRLERWMRSKLSAITALTPSRLVPLAAQSRLRAGAVFLAGDDHQRHALVLVAHGRVVDRHARRSACRVMPPSVPRDHLVADADVGEGAAHHHVDDCRAASRRS